MDYFQGGIQPQWPLELFIEVSNVCDLRCAMCPTFSGLNTQLHADISRRHRGFFDLNIIDDKLDEALKHALVVHAFGYGEPTLHPQFTTLIKKLGRYDVMVDFFTHGMHLEDELCEEMVKQRVSKITVSFSGANKDDYENIYLGGDYEKVLASLKRLDRHKKAANAEFPLIVINSLAFKHHVKHLPDFVKIMANAGANVIQLKPLQIYDKIQELQNHASVFEQEQRAILEQAETIAREHGVTLGFKEYENSAARKEIYEAERTENTVPITQLKEIADRKRKKKGAYGKMVREKMVVKVQEKDKVEYTEDPSIYCIEPFKTLYLSYEGAAYPCCFKKEKSIWGDLNIDNAMEIWNSDLMQSFRNHAREQQYPYDLCNNCMKTHAYPKRNPARMHALHYSRWLNDKYNTSFDQQLMQRIREMPEWNQDLFINQKQSPHFE